MMTTADMIYVTKEHACNIIFQLRSFCTKKKDLKINQVHFMSKTSIFVNGILRD